MNQKTPGQSKEMFLTIVCKHWLSDKLEYSIYMYIKCFSIKLEFHDDQKPNKLSSASLIGPRAQFHSSEQTAMTVSHRIAGVQFPSERNWVRSEMTCI